MNTKTIYFLFVVLILFSGDEGLAANTYICEQPDGTRSFQDIPCESKTLKIEERNTHDSGSEQYKRQTSSRYDQSQQETTRQNQDKIQIQAKQLLGKWTDATGKGAELVRGIWVFTQDTLITTRANGITHTHQYKLDGNTLVIHHPDDPVFKQKAWIQRIEIEDFDGKRLTLGEGRLAASKYLYKLQ